MYTRPRDRKSTRLNSSHGYISYAVFCLKKQRMMSWTPRPDCSFLTIQHVSLSGDSAVSMCAAFCRKLPSSATDVELHNSSFFFFWDGNRPVYPSLPKCRLPF